MQIALIQLIVASFPLTELAYTCDRAQSVLSRASAYLHQQGHYQLSDIAESAIVALEDAASRLVWWGRPAYSSMVLTRVSTMLE